MQSLFNALRQLTTDRTDLSADTAAADTRPADAPQVLGAHELALVSGGDGDPIGLPVTKW